MKSSELILKAVYCFTLHIGERNKDVNFKNPLKLIPKQSPKISTAKTTSFPVVLLRVKLVQIAPMPEVLRIENVSLLETQERQPFKPTVKRVLSCGIHECIQTMSRGNEGKYSLHVSSETGAPHVSLNLSISMARSLDLPCAFTTTRHGMMLTSTASNIQQSRALEVEELIPLQRRPGTLLVMIQSSATRWTLPPLVSALPQSSSRFPAVLSTLLPENASTTAINYRIKINRVPREALPLSIVTTPPQPRPRGADEDSLAILNHSEEISHELPDSSRSEIVEVTDVDEPLKISDIQDTTAFKSGM